MRYYHACAAGFALISAGAVAAAQTSPPQAPTAGRAGAPPSRAVQWHGYIQSREYFADGAKPEPKIERVSLSALAPFADNKKLYAEVYYHDWTTCKHFYLESLYFDTGFGDGRLRIGKGRLQTFGITPSYPNRKTSNYGLVAEAFTQDRVHGIQYTWSRRTLDLGLSLHTSYRLGRRSESDVPGVLDRNVASIVPHFALRDIQDQMSRNLQTSGRIGARWNGWKVGLDGSFGAMDPRDTAALQGTNGALRPRNPFTGAVTPALDPTNNDGTIKIYGADFMKRWASGWVAQGEVFDARMGSLGYDAYELLGGYEVRNGWKFYVRYGAQNIHNPATDNPLTWDTGQWTLSLVQPLRKNWWLQYECELNTEKPNVPGHVNNNVGFVELFTGF